MYNPKINDELIPKLYKLAKKKNKPMTKLVSEIIEEYLDAEDESSRRHNPTIMGESEARGQESRRLA